MKAAKPGPGRPKVNPLPRAEQLRIAKRSQRERDRKKGLVNCQVRLHELTAEKLRAGLGIPGFEAQMRHYLDQALVEVDRFPNLRLLCWSRRDRYITDREAFGLYERNWRFVDVRRLGARERDLIDRLARTYGGGLLNV